MAIGSEHDPSFALPERRFSLSATFNPSVNQPPYQLAFFSDFSITTPDICLPASHACVGGVPEPASWALLIAGFGLTGAVMRRRRLSDATA